jgi:hypothetical protein
MQRVALVLAMAVAGVFGPIVAAKAESPAIGAENQFRFQFEEAQRSHRGQAVEGYLYNGLPWRITNVGLTRFRGQVDYAACFTRSVLSCSAGLA